MGGAERTRQGRSAILSRRGQRDTPRGGARGQQFAVDCKRLSVITDGLFWVGARSSSCSLDNDIQQLGGVID